MNETNFEHAIYGVLIQMALGLLTGNWWIGAAAGAFFFLGREHAQFERHLIDAGGASAALNPLAGFEFWKWSLDSKLDLVFPSVSVLGVAVGHFLGVRVPLNALLALLVLLNVADAVLTVIDLKRGNREANPIMAKVMGWIGVIPALAVLKVAMLAVVYIIITIVARGWVYGPYVVAALCGLFGLIVCNNWRLYAVKA